LKVSAFDRAVDALHAAGLILSGDGRDRVQLAPDARTDELVRRLVECGLAVFEVTPLERTLEDFYLALMKQSGVATPPGAPDTPA
jgi:hypothetical protein